MTSHPPIRIVTRLLAELQTAILGRGLALTEGDLGRFAMLSLVAGQAGRPAGAAGMSIKSLSDTLSKPYETVRRQAEKLVADGLCERGHGGLHIARTPAAAARLVPVMTHAHDAFVRFVADLRAQEVALPPANPNAPYRPDVGVGGAADIMLTVLDGNLPVHRDWLQLVIFSAVLGGNVAGFAYDPARARAVADERTRTPAAWLRPVRAAAVIGVLGLAETTVRRQLSRMTADGVVVRQAGGYAVSEAWLNGPAQVAVSRESFANVRRVLARVGAAGFPLDRPEAAYLHGRPADVWAEQPNRAEG